MKKKVVSQTTGITDDITKEFQTAKQIKNFSCAKHALLKALGYMSGKRGELVADQLEKRSHLIVDLAKKGDDSAKEFMAASGINYEDSNAHEQLESLMGHTRKHTDYTPR